MFWCACIIASFLLFRKSNLVPDVATGFDPEKQLKRSDFFFTSNNVIVGIRWAKNEQFNRELLTFPLPIIPNSVLCPVKTILNVFITVRGHPSQHLLALGNGTSLTYRRFQDKLRSILKQNPHVDESLFSSHSFRRGGCTFAFLSGVPPELIKLLGNWRSDCYLKYLEFPLEARTAAIELMKL